MASKCPRWVEIGRCHPACLHDCTPYGCSRHTSQRTLKAASRRFIVASPDGSPYRGRRAPGYQPVAKPTAAPARARLRSDADAAAATPAPQATRPSRRRHTDRLEPRSARPARSFRPSSQVRTPLPGGFDTLHPSRQYCLVSADRRAGRCAEAVAGRPAATGLCYRPVAKNLRLPDPRWGGAAAQTSNDAERLIQEERCA